MPHKYDVIIVGAGPAGSTAGAILAGAGITVLVLEQKKEIGVPSHCGEVVSQHVIELFDNGENRSWIVRKMKGTKIFFPNGKFMYYPETGYSIDRVAFDQSLADNAVKKGAKIALGQRVLGVARRQGQWEISTSQNTLYKCEHLIAADGCNSTVRRSFGISLHAAPAMQYKFPYIKKFASEYNHFYYGREFFPGFAWIFDRGCETSIGLGGPVKLREKLESFLKEIDVDPASRKSVHMGLVPHIGRAVGLVKNRVIFAGDAGGFVFPLTGGGVIGALISGKTAGELVRDAITDRDPDIVSAYPERLKFLPSNSNMTLFFSRRFLSLGEAALNALGDLIHGRSMFELPLLKASYDFLRKPAIPRINAYFTGYICQRLCARYRRWVF